MGAEKQLRELVYNKNMKLFILTDSDKYNPDYKFSKLEISDLLDGLQGKFDDLPDEPIINKNVVEDAIKKFNDLDDKHGTTLDGKTLKFDNEDVGAQATDAAYKNAIEGVKNLNKTLIKKRKDKKEEKEIQELVQKKKKAIETKQHERLKKE